MFGFTTMWRDLLIYIPDGNWLSMIDYVVNKFDHASQQEWLIQHICLILLLIIISIEIP